LGRTSACEIGPVARCTLLIVLRRSKLRVFVASRDRQETCATSAWWRFTKSVPTRRAVDTDQNVLFQVPEAEPRSEGRGELAGISAGGDHPLDRQGELDERPTATVREVHVHACPPPPHTRRRYVRNASLEGQAQVAPNTRRK